MLTDEEYDEQEAEAERIAEIQRELAYVLGQEGVHSERIERGLYVHGDLNVIMEFCQRWRSEIEELQ